MSIGCCSGNALLLQLLLLLQRLLQLLLQLLLQQLLLLRLLLQPQLQLQLLLQLQLQLLKLLLQLKLQLKLQLLQLLQLLRQLLLLQPLQLVVCAVRPEVRTTSESYRAMSTMAPENDAPMRMPSHGMFLATQWHQMCFATNDSSFTMRVGS